MEPISTTEQEKHSAGQRNINRVWEYTQASIAVLVTLGALTISSSLALYGEKDSKTAAFVFICGVANLVIGFYFGRTNHQRSGGIGGDNAGSR